MHTLRWLRMSDDEIDDFLGKGGTGVISFSTDSTRPPYSLPISYGYAAENDHFHFRIAFQPGSEKRGIVERPVSFVTYGRTDSGWRSVIAIGELDEITDSPYDSPDIQERWRVVIPIVDIFEEPPDEVSFRQFRLIPEELSGRKEVPSGR